VRDALVPPPEERSRDGDRAALGGTEASSLASPDPPRRAPGWEGRALLLAVCLGAVAAALMLQPAPPAGALSLAGIELPGVCAFKAATGVPCPGCGLTRSFVSAVRGDLSTSLAHHRMGAVILFYLLAQLGRQAAWLGFPGRRAAVEGFGSYLDKGLIVVAAALLVAWAPVLVGALTPAVGR
jgi:hypothetical protein